MAEGHEEHRGSRRAQHFRNGFQGTLLQCCSPCHKGLAQCGQVLLEAREHFLRAGGTVQVNQHMQTQAAAELRLCDAVECSHGAEDALMSGGHRKVEVPRARAAKELADEETNMGMEGPVAATGLAATRRGRSASQRSAQVLVHTWQWQLSLLHVKHLHLKGQWMPRVARIQCDEKARKAEIKLQGIDFVAHGMASTVGAGHLGSDETQRAQQVFDLGGDVGVGQCLRHATVLAKRLVHGSKIHTAEALQVLHRSLECWTAQFGTHCSHEGTAMQDGKDNSNEGVIQAPRILFGGTIFSGEQHACPITVW